MKTGKLLVLGMIFIILFGIFTNTLEGCMCLCFGIFVLWLLYKIFTKNNQFKYKISVARDFLKYKYGEKMGNYILQQTLNERKNRIKNHGDK